MSISFTLFNSLFSLDAVNMRSYTVTLFGPMPKIVSVRTEIMHNYRLCIIQDLALSCALGSERICHYCASCLTLRRMVLCYFFEDLYRITTPCLVHTRNGTYRRNEALSLAKYVQMITKSTLTHRRWRVTRE